MRCAGLSRWRSAVQLVQIRDQRTGGVESGFRVLELLYCFT